MLAVRWPQYAPEGRDVLVFGDWSPNRDPVAHPGPYRICFEHPGMWWYGVRDCWVCEAVKRA